MCTNMPVTVLIFKELMHVQQLPVKTHIPNFKKKITSNLVTNTMSQTERRGLHVRCLFFYFAKYM